ncbi:MAG: hypothetical protein JWL99_3906 [Streptomyces oryziradicis]|nr:hypothetical protein [Actinacidiphila oryziradicis]
MGLPRPPAPDPAPPAPSSSAGRLGLSCWASTVPPPLPGVPLRPQAPDGLGLSCWTSTVPPALPGVPLRPQAPDGLGGRACRHAGWWWGSGPLWGDLSPPAFGREVPPGGAPTSAGRAHLSVCRPRAASRASDGCAGLRPSVPAASRCPLAGLPLRPQTPDGLGFGALRRCAGALVRWLGRGRLRGDSPPTFGREVPPQLCARTRRSLRHRHRHLGDTVCGDTPAPPPPAVTAPHGGLCPAVTLGVARRAGRWFYGLRHGKAVTRPSGREGTRRGVPAGDERMHPGQVCCGPARASPEEITPQRPRPPPRISRAGTHDHPARPAFEDGAATIAEGAEPARPQSGQPAAPVRPDKPHRGYPVPLRPGRRG